MLGVEAEVHPLQVMPQDLQRSLTGMKVVPLSPYSIVCKIFINILFDTHFYLVGGLSVVHDDANQGVGPSGVQSEFQGKFLYLEHSSTKIN